MFSFSDPIEKLPQIKPFQAIKLQGLGIFSVEDLLYHFPSRYEDYSQTKQIAEVSEGDIVTLRGKISSINTIRTWKRKMTITEAILEDQSGSIKAVWFNNPLPVKFLSQGKYAELSGKIARDKKKQLHIQHPNIQLISKSQYESLAEQSEERAPETKTNTGSLVPVYPQTKDLNSYWLRRVFANLIPEIDPIEFLPQDILLSQNLPNVEDALKNIHFPASIAQANQAKKRFAFEKMLLFQIKALQTKKQWEAQGGIPLKFHKNFIKKFVDSLPFKLTNSQKKSAWQIILDLEKTTPMNRLVEGDVGSGKTIVAMLAILSVLKNKRQAVLLAPTEVLATQHFKTISQWLPRDYASALLTSSKHLLGEKKISKEQFKKELSAGTAHVIIGTHALLQEKIKFKNLALVIVDEQHRFGVNQRAFLLGKTRKIMDGSKKTVPHFLTMTATPIPRTLSLALFGNLDLSIINEFPKGRKEIITKVIPPQGRSQIYDFVKNQLSLGKQAFVICPLVEESSKISEVKAATEEHQKLQTEIFPEFKLALLHGKMKPKEKNEVMKDFKEKEFNALVSTSVIEVGIDIPNATVMIIEGAERFGLAQLHQFRGRVGRGTDQSYCFLFTSQNSAPTTKRLSVLEKTNDGFKIAEEDMKLRGPGQFLGTLQSGVPDIAMESLTDTKTIQQARIEAQKILSEDFELKRFPLLKKQIEKINFALHWE